MGDRTEVFENVLLGARTPGTLKMNAAGLAWKATGGSGRTLAHRRDEIHAVAVVRSLQGYQVRLHLANHAQLKLDGFTRESVGVLRKFMKDHYGKSADEREYSLKGVHWGEVDVKDSVVSLMSAGKPALDVPLAAVSNAIILPSRQDIALELDADADGQGDVAVVEVQLHVPEGSKLGAVPEKYKSLPAAEALHRMIKDNSGRTRETQTPIAKFSELSCTHPSGKFDIELFEKLFWVSSTVNEYKLSYDNIQRIFLLPKDADKLIVVIALNTTIRQGQTQYNYLIFSFDDSDELKITLSLSEHEIATKFQGKLKPEYDGAAYGVFTQLLAGVSGKTVTTVGDNPFVNEYDQKFVQCTFKTNRGFLYPLRKAFLFVSKTPLYIGYSSINKIEFSGLEATSSVFDMKITATPDGAKEDDDRVVYNFQQIARLSFNPLKEFCVAKDLRVKQVTPVVSSKVISMKEASGDEDEDDEDSPDEDFAPAEESDVEEEYDEGSEVEDAPAPKAKPAGKGKGGDAGGKAKRARDAADDDDGNDDGDDMDEAPPMPAKKGKGKAKAAGEAPKPAKRDKGKDKDGAAKPKPAKKPKTKKGDDDE